MDCETARQWLEACRDDSDHAEALPLGVAEHVQLCTACREAQQAIAVVDGWIGARIRNVAVPDGLKQRLLERVAAADPATVQTAVPPDGAEPKPDAVAPSGRRRWRGRSAKRRLWIGAGAAVAASVALLAMWLIDREPRWSRAEVVALIREVASASLEEPAEGLTRPMGLRRNAVYKEGVIDLRGVDIPVLHYRVAVRGRTVECEVYVIPKAMITDPIPSMNRMVATTDVGMTIAIWQERQDVFVFVCRGAGGEEVLQRLRPTPQLT
jgi:hypothetical protein